MRDSAGQRGACGGGQGKVRRTADRHLHGGKPVRWTVCADPAGRSQRLVSDKLAQCPGDREADAEFRRGGVLMTLIDWLRIIGIWYALISIAGVILSMCFSEEVHVGDGKPY